MYGLRLHSKCKPPEIGDDFEGSVDPIRLLILPWTAQETQVLTWIVHFSRLQHLKLSNSLLIIHPAKDRKTLKNLIIVYDRIYLSHNCSAGSIKRLPAVANCIQKLHYVIPIGFLIRNADGNSFITIVRSKWERNLSSILDARKEWGIRMVKLWLILLLPIKMYYCTEDQGQKK